VGKIRVVRGVIPRARANLLKKKAFSGILSFLIFTIYHFDAILEEKYS
jgi:hypothetical protein